MSMYFDDTGNWVEEPEETTDEGMISDAETADDKPEKPIENKCFMIWRDDEDILQALSANQKGQLLDLLCQLAFHDEDTELSTIKNAVVRLAYSRIGGKVRVMKAKYLASVPKKREAGSKGGKATASKEFIPPTVDDVKRYCNQTQNYIDVDAFMRQYTESNWTDKDGKPVKNWKNVVRGWYNRNPMQKKDFMVATGELTTKYVDGKTYYVDSDGDYYDMNTMMPVNIRGDGRAWQ